MDCRGRDRVVEIEIWMGEGQIEGWEIEKVML